MLKIHKWNRLQAREVPKLLRGNFPKCGVKFTNKYGTGLVLIKYDVSNLALIKDKVNAAGEGAMAFIIPLSVGKVYNI